MNTKNIFKALALAMLMPAMLLTTACSSEDDIVNAENTENTIKKGFELPVTINVTRQDDGATRATYNESTRKLEFSTGDKLFVEGVHIEAEANRFAGTLTWQSGGTFTGTIYTQNPYTGTADELFTAASASGIVNATLLPNGYESYNFLSIYNNGSDDLYDDVVAWGMLKAFVASETAKATGVEQLSFERASTYSSGFALAPRNAILNFTITGLEAGAQDVTLYIDYGGVESPVTGSVTPNASGVATFAIGVTGGANIKNMDNNLTVGTHNFTLPSSTTFTVGKIYNISRSVAADPTVTLTPGEIGDLTSWGSNSKTINGITIAVSGDAHFFTTGLMDVTAFDPETGEPISTTGTYTFTSSVGKIKRIDINHNGGKWWGSGAGWPGSYEVWAPSTFTWSGTPAASVTLNGSGNDMDNCTFDVSSIVFTLGE